MKLIWCHQAVKDLKASIKGLHLSSMADNPVSKQQLVRSSTGDFAWNSLNFPEMCFIKTVEACALNTKPQEPIPQAYSVLFDNTSRVQCRSTCSAPHVTCPDQRHVQRATCHVRCHGSNMMARAAAMSTRTLVSSCCVRTRPRIWRQWWWQAGPSERDPTWGPPYPVPSPAGSQGTCHRT